MIHLRELRSQDAYLMLKCLHDPDIQKSFRKRMSDYTLDDCITFIRNSHISNNLTTGISLHFAIVDTPGNEYLGTVSLKNLDLENSTAEYAILTRKEVHGRGIAFEATKRILEKAFYEFGLRRVYLCVYSNNSDALKLYEKCGFQFEGSFRKHFVIAGEYVDWLWYGILREEYLSQIETKQENNCDKKIN